jgi:hypothetical protein
MSSSGRQARRNHPFLAASFAMVIPVAAHAELSDGIAAALQACTDPAPSLTRRITDLAAAGWLTQSDTPETRDRFALYALLRYGDEFAAGDARKLNQFADIRDRPLLLTEPGGQAPATDAVLAPLLAATGYSGFQYELPGQAATLFAQLVPVGDPGTAATLECSLILGPAIDAESLSSFVPTAGSVTDETKGAAPETIWRKIRVNGDNDAFQFTLDHYDLSTNAGFQAFLTDAKSHSGFGALIVTALTPVPLK